MSDRTSYWKASPEASNQIKAILDKWKDIDNEARAYVMEQFHADGVAGIRPTTRPWELTSVVFKNGNTPPDALLKMCCKKPELQWSGSTRLYLYTPMKRMPLYTVMSKWRYDLPGEIMRVLGLKVLTYVDGTSITMVGMPLTIIPHTDGIVYFSMTDLTDKGKRRVPKEGTATEISNIEFNAIEDKPKKKKTKTITKTKDRTKVRNL
jgi:hypothetical protein